MKLLHSKLMLVLMLCAYAVAGDGLKPFILAFENDKSMAQNIASVKEVLQKENIQIAGEYSPYANSHIITITSDELIVNASATAFGGFGAMIRIAITKTKDNTQVSYNNPAYLSSVYRMKKEPTKLISQLSKALGNIKEFGSDKSYSKDVLESYQYKMFMPYFDDEIKVAKYKNHKTAIESIESGLAKNTAGVGQVYKINLSSNSVVFGVSMSQKSSSDKFIMGEIDFKKLKSTAHLPYEILLVDNKAFILPAEFRIAINFPELSMMGSNSFMNIMSAPTDIKDAISSAIK